MDTNHKIQNIYKCTHTHRPRHVTYVYSCKHIRLKTPPFFALQKIDEVQPFNLTRRLLFTPFIFRSMPATSCLTCHIVFFSIWKAVQECLRGYKDYVLSFSITVAIMLWVKKTETQFCHEVGRSTAGFA